MINNVRIGTLFSGIGAAEFALKRLGITHEIVFACDNGELMLSADDETIQKQLALLPTVEERKAYIKSLIPKKTSASSKGKYSSSINFCGKQPVTTSFSKLPDL